MLNKEEIKNLVIDSNLIIHYKFNNKNKNYNMGKFTPEEVSLNCFVFKKTNKKIGLNINGQQKLFKLQDFSEQGIHFVDSIFHFYLEVV